MTDAAQRIELSRARLRRAMSPPPESRRFESNHHLLGEVWFEKLKSVPLLGPVVEALDSWWSHHPLRPMTQVVGQASTAAVKPFAQKKPISLVAGAAIAGALMVWSKPWRWLIRPALFAGLVPQIASRLVARIPLESWMAGLDRPAPRHGAPL